MARPKAQTRRPVSRPGTKSSPKKGLLIAILVVLLLVIGGIAAWILWPSYETFNRATLDKYVEASMVDNKLEDGAAIYIDMSDGMLSAYREETPKMVLKSTINKLAADEAIEFFTLSSGQIEHREMSHTELFNYVLKEANYEKRWSAPIEETLRTIVENRQPAILMSDFEEYNNGQIQRAAYAKRYFIEWLAMGYKVTFYKWNFVENNVNKSMFIAVFDDNYERLNSLVATALNPFNLESFVLAGREYAFPTSVSYNTVNEGGGYRNGGMDNVTNIKAEGGPEDYCCYASPKATPSGKGQFSNLTQLVGSLAEYYPLGISWKDAIQNMDDFKKHSDNNARFTHLLQGLYIGLDSQSGYMVTGVELRVFDITPIMEKVAKKQNITMNDVEAWDADCVEIFDMMTVSMGDSISGATYNLYPFYVDIKSGFNGSFSGGVETDAVLCANIVISHVEIEYDKVERFFAWDSNTSLYDSVKEALEAPSSSPIGRVLYTYYFKALEE